jgi:hypothetical protein
MNASSSLSASNALSSSSLPSFSYSTPPPQTGAGASMSNNLFSASSNSGGGSSSMGQPYSRIPSMLDNRHRMMSPQRNNQVISSFLLPLLSFPLSVSLFVFNVETQWRRWSTTAAETASTTQHSLVLAEQPVANRQWRIACDWRQQSEPRLQTPSLRQSTSKPRDQRDRRRYPR